MPPHTLRTFVDDKDRNQVYDVQHVQAWVLDQVVGAGPTRPPVGASSLRALIQAAMALHAGWIAHERLVELHAGSEPQYSHLYEQEAMRSGAFAHVTALDMCATAAWARDIEDERRPSPSPSNWPNWRQACGGARSGALMDQLQAHMSQADVDGLIEHRNAWAHRPPVADQHIEVGSTSGSWGPLSKIVVDGRGTIPCVAASVEADRAIVIDAYISAAYLLTGQSA